LIGAKQRKSRLLTTIVSLGLIGCSIAALLVRRSDIGIDGAPAASSSSAPDSLAGATVPVDSVTFTTTSVVPTASISTTPSFECKWSPHEVFAGGASGDWITIISLSNTSVGSCQLPEIASVGSQPTDTGEVVAKLNTESPLKPFTETQVAPAVDVSFVIHSTTLGICDTPQTAKSVQLTMTDGLSLDLPLAAPIDVGCAFSYNGFGETPTP